MSTAETNIDKRETNQRSRSKSFKEAVAEANVIKSEFIQHETPELSYSNQAYAFFTKLFVDHLPLEALHHLKVSRMIVFGLFSYAIFFAMFLGFAISGYIQLRKEEFLSLDQDSGTCQ